MIDWPATWWLPADVFGPGKVLVFADVLEKDGTPYVADIRARLKTYLDRRSNRTASWARTQYLPRQ